MKRKNVIICHSAEEMDRKADALMEQGYQVERESGVQLVQTLCFPIYKARFWSQDKGKKSYVIDDGVY